MSRLVKRIMDVCIAIFGFIVLSPILFIISILMLLTEGRPIFYVSQRHLSPQKQFRVVKFRTMVKDATNEEKYELHKKYFRGGFLDIPLEDKVYTPIGRFLEYTQLVEVPQFYNVLRGEMSISGNRPLPTKNLDKLQENENWKLRFKSPPGITGITQIVGKFSLDPSTRLKLESSYSVFKSL